MTITPSPCHEKLKHRAADHQPCGSGSTVKTVVTGSTEEGQFTRKTISWGFFLTYVGGSKSLWLWTAALDSHCLVSSPGSNTSQLCDVGQLLNLSGPQFLYQFLYRYNK